MDSFGQRSLSSIDFQAKCKTAKCKTAGTGRFFCSDTCHQKCQSTFDRLTSCFLHAQLAVKFKFKINFGQEYSALWFANLYMGPFVSLDNSDNHQYWVSGPIPCMTRYKWAKIMTTRVLFSSIK